VDADMGRVRETAFSKRIADLGSLMIWLAVIAVCIVLLALAVTAHTGWARVTGQKRRPRVGADDRRAGAPVLEDR
jgi:hypothetical protein